jgi:hypothetical protein
MPKLLCFATEAPSYRVQPSGRQSNDQFCDWSSAAEFHLAGAAEGVQVALAAVAVRAAHALQRGGLSHRLAGPRHGACNAIATGHVDAVAYVRSNADVSSAREGEESVRCITLQAA